MRIGILCAGDDELAPFLTLIQECTATEKAKLNFIAGKSLTQRLSLYIQASAK